MKLTKNKLPLSEPRSATSKLPPKTPSAKYQGSRYNSLVLLAVTILISLVFYVSGQ